MILRIADHLAHLLYEPALLGRRCANIPEWQSRIHLIPGAWLNRVCARYENSRQP